MANYDQPSRETVTALFDDMHKKSRSEPVWPLEKRLEYLRILERIVVNGEREMEDVIEADYGTRGRLFSQLGEIFSAVTTIRYMIANLPKWMERRKKSAGFPLSLYGRCYIQPQPLGVVAIIAPWNFPVQLSINGIATALAAGNRVILKPSELVPRTSAWLANKLNEAFPRDVLTVITGDAEVAKHLTTLPADKILFTGGTEVGKHVAAAAAPNLTPTCLELGGKSPVVVCGDYDLSDAALKVSNAKLGNAGQICIAPDYALVPKGTSTAFVEAAQKAVRKHWGTARGNELYTSIISKRHYERLLSLLDDAREKGARVVPLSDDEVFSLDPSSDERRMPPFAILGATPEMRVMKEEIFGPLLPVVEYDSVSGACARINEGEKPLALYIFTNDASTRDYVISHTTSGGVTVNDLLLHALADELPFGGVGHSGMGAYHGEAGFNEFSHLKPIYEWKPLPLLPPFLPPGPPKQDMSALIKYDVAGAFGKIGSMVCGLTKVVKVALIVYGLYALVRAQQRKTLVI